MLTFLISLAALLLGFSVYSRVAERVFGPDGRPTPAIEKADGVDYIVLPTWRIFMIQFLNIAGTGPIFGAIMGMWYGPAAYVWIVLGCVFGGALLMLVWQIASPDGFRTIWQYMGWGTQFLAAVSLWVCTVYLARKHKFYWMTLVPALFMTVVCTAFILVSPIAFGLPRTLSYVLTAVITVALLSSFFYWKGKTQPTQIIDNKS